MAGPIHGISGGRTTRPENVIPVRGLSQSVLVPLSYVMILKASLFGREDGSLALIKDQYSPVDTTSNFKVSSTFAEIMREKRASVSFRPARRPSGIRRAPERSYSCDTCGEQYSQPQGVSRHRRRAHNPHACLCCEFKWSRPYQYRDHLEKHHPDVDRDYILGKRAGSRRRSTIIGRDLPHYIPLPAIQPDRRSGAEPQQRPLAPPLSMPTKFTHASSSAISPVTSDPQPKYAEQVMSTNKVEDVRGLEYQFLGTIDPAPMFSSGEGIQSVTTRIFPSEVAKFGWHILFFTPHM